MNQKIIGYASGILSAVFMGLSWYATKRITQITGAHVFDILSTRYIISLTILFLLWRTGVIRLNYKGKNVLPLVEISLLVPIAYNILEYSALNYISSAEIGMLCSLMTIAAPVLGFIWLKERITFGQVIFMIVAMSGVVFLNAFDFDPADSSNIGRLLMLGCVVVSSVDQVLIRRSSFDFSPIEITTVMMLVSTVVMVPLAVGRHLMLGTMGEYIGFLGTPSIYGYLLFLSFGPSILGYYLGSTCLRLTSVLTSSVLNTFITITAVVSGAFLLHEPLEWYDYTGCVIVVAGVIGCNVVKARADKKAS